MLKEPMDIKKQFPIRKSKKQKESFRAAVTDFAAGLGYSCETEKFTGGSNLVIGDPEAAKFLITAHYDTPAALPFPNLITPCNAVTFLLYQFFVIGLYLLVSFGAGFAVYFLTNSEDAAFWTGYVLYFVMLILMMVGPANRNNANDNTSGVVTVLETARTMPENLRHQVCFVLFDLEEAGLLGSSAYRKTHKAATENQVILNLDCVGDGNEILLFPTKKLKKDESKLAVLRSACGSFGNKRISLRDKGFSVYPSDQRNFPLGVGIAAFRKTKSGLLYCGRIHTKKDTVLDHGNVNLLRAALTTCIGKDDMQEKTQKEILEEIQ